MALVPRVYALPGSPWARIWRSTYRPDTDDWACANGGLNETAFDMEPEFGSSGFNLTANDEIRALLTLTSNQAGGTDKHGMLLQMYRFTRNAYYCPVEGNQKVFDIDDTNLFFSNNSSYGYVDADAGGIGLFNGLYWVWGSNDAGIPKSMVVYSSSDRQIWTEEDTAGNPLVGTGYRVSVFLETEGIILWAYLEQPAYTNVTLYEFDLTTKTWGVGFAALVLSSASLIISIFRLSTGDTVLVYTRPTIFPANPLFIRVYNGISWSSEVQISVNVYEDVAKNPHVIMDSEDRIHFFYWQSNAGNQVNFHRSRSSLGVLSSQHEFTFGIPADPGSTSNKFACALFSRDELWAFHTASTSGGVTGLKVWRGTPTSSPTWTQMPIDQSGIASPWGYIDLFCAEAEVTTPIPPAGDTFAYIR
jgi:hypothetical protein